MHPAQSPEDKSSLHLLASLLRHTVRITVNDGRVFLGTFAGTDKPLNILLVNAEEYRIGINENPAGRFVGQIMIPWKIVTKVETPTEVIDYLQEADPSRPDIYV